MASQLTIIVPVYNAEKVLPACLESLRSQTVPVRVLLADDGTVPPAEDPPQTQPHITLLQRIRNRIAALGVTGLLTVNW